MRHSCFWAVTAAILALLTLAACSSGPGPGAACDTCAVAEASATGPFAEAAAAAADGGQTASNQPIQQDPGARHVYTPVSRGTGNQSVTTTTNDPRSQAGAPSVNQGLILPTEANAATGGGVSPVVASLQGYIDDLRTQYKLAVMQGDHELEKRISDNIDRAISQMAQAQASTRGVTNNTFNLQGSVNTQTVANGSNSGDGQTAIDPRNSEALAGGLPKTVEAATAAAARKPAVPKGDAPASPGGSPDSAPPAGEGSDPLNPASGG